MPKDVQPECSDGGHSRYSQIEWSDGMVSNNMEWKSSLLYALFCSYHFIRSYGDIHEAQRHAYIRGDIRKAHATPVSAPFCRTPAFSLAAMMLSDSQSP